MRALILRRLGLIEQGLGPIIVGNGDDARLVGLQGFLRRNAYPATVIDARSDSGGRRAARRHDDRPRRFSAGVLPERTCAARAR